MKRNMAVKVAALAVAVATCSRSLLAASKAEAAKWKMFDRRIGMFGSVCEILLEGAIPPQWPHGSATGLRTRAGKTINVSW